jgi:hypothetical protein
MAQRAKLPKLDLRADITPVDGEQAPAKSTDRRDREGKKIIAGHFPRSIWVEFRRLALDKDKTAQELLEEALADLFAKYKH